VVFVALLAFLINAEEDRLLALSINTDLFNRILGVAFLLFPFEGTFLVKRFKWVF